MNNFSSKAIEKALELTKIGVWDYIISTQEVKWNNEMFYLFDKKITTDIQYNKDVMLLIHPEDRERVDKQFINLIENNTEFESRYRVIWNDDSLHFYQAQGEKYVDDNGFERILGTVIDLTDYYIQKENEKEKLVLQHLNDYETRHNTEMHLIMRTVAHEIRNPLQGILGSATLIDNMLQNVSTEEPDIVSGLNTMKCCMDDLMECIYHQLTTLNDLIDYNLKQSGSILDKVLVETVDLEAIFSSVSKMFNTNAKKNNNTITSSVDKNLKNVLTDPKRLKRIIINLVSNSLKFTNSGNINITASEDIKDNKCVICVEDTGDGIPDIKKKNIFSRIGDSTSDSNDMTTGSGLGLSICKKLVKSLNGEIYCKNNIPKGTKMIFTFDLKYKHDEISEIDELNEIRNNTFFSNEYDTVNVNSTDINNNSVNNNSQCKNTISEYIQNIVENTIMQNNSMKDKIILLADDNSINQKVVNRMLIDSVKEIIIASNGNEVIEQFNKKKFDIIILDVYMPFMSGIEAATIIRQTDSETPILFLTGEAMTCELAHFTKSVVLLKPCAKVDLIRTCTGMFLNTQ